LDGNAKEGLAVASWAPNRLDVFAVGTDNALYHKWRDSGTWSGWERFDAYCLGAPAAVSWGPNRLDVFVVGSDHQVYHLWFDGNRWNGWESFGGNALYGVAASSSQPNQLSVYTVGTDHNIYSRFWDGKIWTGWQKVDSFSMSAPAAVGYAPDSLLLACVGTGNNLYWNDYYNSTYHGWNSLGPLCLDVAMSSWGPSRIDFFVRSSDLGVFQRTFDNGSWSGWLGHGGASNYAAAAVSPGPNWIELFVIGGDGALYQKSYA
jgi:hypothetical protein